MEGKGGGVSVALLFEESSDGTRSQDFDARDQ